MENTNTPYEVTNKLTGEVLTDVSWTSDVSDGGEEGNFMEFGMADGTKVRFNRPEHQVDAENFDNGSFTAKYVNQIPVVETPTETA